MAKDEIASNTTAEKGITNVGELKKFIPQVSKNMQNWSSDSKEVELVLKGPILMLENLTFKLQNYYNKAGLAGNGLSEFISNTAEEIQWDTSNYSSTINTPISIISFPPTPTGSAWYINSWKVEECDAGVHCIVTIIWKPKKTSQSQEDEEPLADYWTCTMQPTQVDVLAYCSDKDGGDATGSDGTARSWRIKQWDSVDNNNNEAKLQYMFNSGVGQNEMCKLNDHEIAIAKFYSQGINPQFHYPVLQHNREYSGAGNVNFGGIDRISNIPDGCPWTLGSWKWLKTGYSVVYNKATQTTTVTEEWTGAESWAEEFYSNNPQVRWIIKGM